MLARTRKAFTLLELIVVIVILGVLALIAIPTFSSVIDKSKKSAAARSAESIGRNAIALAAFQQETDVLDGTSPNFDAVKADTYLEQSAAEAGITGGAAVTVDGTAKTIKVDTGAYVVDLTITGSKVVAGTVVAG